MRNAKADRFLGKSDWRLPNKDDVGSIVGKFDVCTNTRPMRAVSNFFQPISNAGGLGKFWSASMREGSPDFAVDVSFNDGFIGMTKRVFSNANLTRLVRNGQPSAINEFNRELSKIGQYEAADITQTRKLEQETAANAQKLRDQAAANAANEARNNAQACGRLYPGKPVGLSYPKPSSIWGAGGSYYADGIIVGVGNQTASARVIGGDMFHSQGYGPNTVHERRCSDF